MKRCLTAFLVTILASSLVFGGRQKDLSGTVEKNTYQDKKYGFSLTLSDNWKYTLQKNEDNFRILMIQRNYDIPTAYVNAPDYTQIPRLVLWTDTTSLHPFAFLDSLVSTTWRSNQKKELIKELEILNVVPAAGTSREPATPRGRKPVEIGGEQGIVWQAKSKYVKEIETTAGELAGTRVNGAYGGAIVAVKHNDRIFVFHLITEWDFFDAILQDAIAIIASLKFGDAPG
ncbi:MAG: hypothetical protein ACREBV_06945 [Candidatus Zixiibacteriota bacterium]